MCHGYAVVATYYMLLNEHKNNQQAQDHFTQALTSLINYAASGYSIYYFFENFVARDSYEKQQKYQDLLQVLYLMIAFQDPSLIARHLHQFHIGKVAKRLQLTPTIKQHPSSKLILLEDTQTSYDTFKRTVIPKLQQGVACVITCHQHAISVLKYDGKITVFDANDSILLQQQQNKLHAPTPGIFFKETYQALQYILLCFDVSKKIARYARLVFFEVEAKHATPTIKIR